MAGVIFEAVLPLLVLGAFAVGIGCVGWRIVRRD